jgi:hypothetical protein
MPEDVTDVDVIPPSPIVGPNHHSERQLPAPSPSFIAHEISPSLDSITEENDELLVLVTEVSKIVLPDAEKEAPAVSRGLTDNTAVLNAMEKLKSEATQNIVESESADLSEVGSKSIAETSEASAEVEEPASQTKEDEGKSSGDAWNAETVQESSKLDVSTESESKTAKQPEELPSVELPQGSGEPELTSSKEETKNGTGIGEDASVEVQEVGPETPPSAPVEQPLVEESAEKPHAVPSPITPFVMGSRQLDDDDDKAHEIATGSEGPNISIHPATPGTSGAKAEFTLKPLDEAKSTAIEEENGRSQVKARKQPKSQSPERPITPNSMRSATKNAKSKNFLKAFWRVVFVDWIGGLIRALCGGGRGGYT